MRRSGRMRRRGGGLAAIVVALLSAAHPVVAADLPGSREHPLVSRYPGQEIRWQEIDNNRPFRIAVGPVTGYRTIDDWIDATGRVTRTLFVYEGTDRTYSEIWQNYVDALTAEGFTLLGQDNRPARRGPTYGSRQWLDVYLAANPFREPGEIGTISAGTSSQGGSAAVVAQAERAIGTVYVVIVVEQHSDSYIGALVDIVEVEATETGLVAVDADAIGRGIAKDGRVVLTGLAFDFDQATLKPTSDAVLAAIASYLGDAGDERFFVVGHTDATGTLAYNLNLSAARARTVVDALVERHGIDRTRLDPHGVGPLSPVATNASEVGRGANRRVELVTRGDH